MERRGFLKGIFGGVTSAGLVIAASRAEIEAFASPLAKHAPLVLDRPTESPEIVGQGEHLYNAAGELVAIITGIDFSIELIDVTSAWDNHRMHLPGRPHFDIRARGIGSVEWNDRDRMPQLRGRTTVVK